MAVARRRWAALLFQIFLCALAPKAVTVVPTVIPHHLYRFFALAIALGFSAYAVCTGTGLIFAVYFVAHTGMNFYMKYVLSQFPVDDELRGMPMAFLLTSIQQFVAFLTFGIFLLCGHLAGRSYTVKKLTTSKEVWTLLCFSLAFAGNIGLNNFSLSLLPMSVNLILRSCLPLATAVIETVVQAVPMGHSRHSRISALQSLRCIEELLNRWMLMLLGVICTATASYCKMPNAADKAEAAVFSLGLCAGIGSLIAGAVNMVLAGVLGNLELNPVDSTVYMALPSGLILLLPAIRATHPVSRWPSEFQPITDWQILQEVFERNPLALKPVLFSGILAFAYNALQYALVHRLSATHASFAGNFNMATGILLSLLIGSEVLPEGHAALFLIAIFGNLLAFTGFTALKA